MRKKTDLKRYQAIAIISLVVLTGSFCIFRLFPHHAAKTEMKSIPSAKDALPAKSESVSVSTPLAKKEMSPVSSPVGHSKVADNPVAVSPEPAPVKARIAIVIDDWGYDGSVLPLLLKIKSPITIAVIPYHKFSKSIAREAKRKGYQVLLHLPLESRSHIAAEKDTIECSMDEPEMRQKLKVLLKSVPGIVGVNNHQGSKATADLKTMNIVLSEIHKEKLFFLDSHTTSKSICLKAATAIGIQFAQSDSFIDLPPLHFREKEYREYIRKKLDQLSAVALKQGSAIGIGHDLHVTLELLRTEIPKLEEKGIQFVFLSELVQSGEQH